MQKKQYDRFGISLFGLSLLLAVALCIAIGKYAIKREDDAKTRFPKNDGETSEVITVYVDFDEEPETVHSTVYSDSSYAPKTLSPARATLTELGKHAPAVTPDTAKAAPVQQSAAQPRKEQPKRSPASETAAVSVPSSPLGSPEETTATPETTAAPETTSDGLIYLGNFKLTAYCGCAKCNGKWAGQTSTGVKPKEGRTIAVDPKVIPYGTHVVINGHEYIAEDCGGGIKGKRIDIFFDSHAYTNQFGVRYADVYIKP